MTAHDTSTWVGCQAEFAALRSEYESALEQGLLDRILAGDVVGVNRGRELCARNCDIIECLAECIALTVGFEDASGYVSDAIHRLGDPLPGLSDALDAYDETQRQEQIAAAIDQFAAALATSAVSPTVADALTTGLRRMAAFWYDDPVGDNHDMWNAVATVLDRPELIIRQRPKESGPGAASGTQAAS